MENLFKKFFKVKLASVEAPAEGEPHNKLEALKKRLDEVEKQKDWNDWTQADRDLVERLEDEIKKLEGGIQK